MHRDAGPAIHFETNKARALLAYLAVETQPHTRLHLAGLLWPEWPEATARTYLRQALLNLRQMLEQPDEAKPYLLSNRQTIQFNPECDYWLDVAVLTHALSMLPQLSEIDASPATMQRVAETLDLYQGDFLEGFFVDGCSAYDEWQLLIREELRRKVVEAASFLARWCERRGDWSHAQQWSWRSLELEPLLEESHLRLMRLLALNGDRNAALSQYVRYSRQLSDELDTAPSREATDLYERIKADGCLGQAEGHRTSPGLHLPGSYGPQLSLPPFLDRASAAPAVETLCLGREPEFALLQTRLDRAVSGHGGVVFVTGEAGRGKTVLLKAFAARAQEQHAELVAARGACSSHDGIGDALLPFREILAQITGDFEAQWVAGTIGVEHARRLWSVFPQTLEALLAFGPDVANTLIPGQGLAGRVALLGDGASWRQQLETLNRLGSPLSQKALFDQLARVLQAVARRRPLLLCIDDLHWVDRASCALLFHLGQRLAGYPLLIIGAYRPEEIAPGSDGERHPLEKVLRELQARFGATTVDLDQAETRPFVDAYLDLEPNRLGSAFREKLLRLGEGHPLFTVELVATMQEQGGLVRDLGGYWLEGSALEWDKLPSRLEGVIGERVDRLPEAQRAVLDVASVEGEEFTAEIVADVLGEDVQALIRELSNRLDRQHHLVAAAAIQRLGERHLSRYRFRHVLFQKYLYNRLHGVERRQ
ncbi:MAG: AAA family ATPase, partial [Nitrososphaerales archaeon]